MSLIPLFLIFLLILTVKTSIIFNPFDNTTFEIHTSKFLHTSKKSWTEFRVPIVPGGATSKDMAACDKLKTSYSVKGLAVILLPQQGCSVEQHAEVGKNAGASAVFIVGGESSDFLASIKFDNKRYNQSVPILMMDTKGFLGIIAELTKNAKNNSTLPVYITVKEDPSIWIQKTGGGGMIFFQVITELIMVVTLIFGIRGQILFAMQQGIIPSAAQLCLLFCNLALICNIICVLDIFSIRRWYVYGLYITTNFFGTVFVNISSMSLAYFFQELLLQKKMSHPGLSYFKIPFILTSAALIIIYIAFCIVILLYQSVSATQKAKFFIPASIYFFVIVFFMMGAYSIITSMKRFKKKGLGRVTITVFCSIVGMFILAVSFTVLGFYSPLNYDSLFAFIIIVFIAQIIIIVPQVNFFF
eukprot:TRINITY_DN769_c0_g1_i1.p1 TRINITY_DN769_c0_g1~~TRINITY_DN769_c0_g1_i1.p1  ORF type:complete len:414 (-),score=37.27 TRINITY_DN769_c0_g1_i1:238-1479(-)